MNVDLDFFYVNFCWWHPFSAEDPLVSKWLFQIFQFFWWRNKLIYTWMTWRWGHFQQIFIFGSTIQILKIYQWKIQHVIQFTHISQSLHPINLSVVLSLCPAVFLRPYSPPAWYLIKAFGPAAGVTSCPSVLYLSASRLLEYWCGPALAAFDVSGCALLHHLKAAVSTALQKNRFC